MSASSTSESFFDFDELFFSRTNTKGIIESGNSVFQKVSKYEWEEILKKPHNIIRHQTMPKGVFYLLWDTILAGKPVGAYVINQAKDHSYYWVFALVTPIQDGFLSIRLKPSSPIFELVKTKYVDLLGLESSKKLSPKESAEILLTVIKSLNFQNYKHFMTEALTQELECRQLKMNLPPLKVLGQLREVIKLSTQIQSKCGNIFTAYSKNSFVPLNLEVQSARIGKEAAPIAIISSQYNDIAKQIKEQVSKIMQAGILVQEKVSDCQFDVCNTILQNEMYSFFMKEQNSSPVEKNVEMSHLKTASMNGVVKAKLSLNEVDADFQSFKSIYAEVRKLTSALDIISISGKIEAAKIKQSSGELLGLLNDLVSFKTSLKNALKEIDTLGGDLMFQTQEIRADLR